LVQRIGTEGQIRKNKVVRSVGDLEKGYIFFYQRAQEATYKKARKMRKQNSLEAGNTHPRSLKAPKKAGKKTTGQRGKRPAQNKSVDTSEQHSGADNQCNITDPTGKVFKKSTEKGGSRLRKKKENGTLTSRWKQERYSTTSRTGAPGVGGMTTLL